MHNVNLCNMFVHVRCMLYCYERVLMILICGSKHIFQKKKIEFYVNLMENSNGRGNALITKR